MPTIEFPNPLSENNLRDINDALGAIEVAKSQIALAKRADIDVSIQEASLLDVEKRLRKVKSVFFPNR